MGVSVSGVEEGEERETGVSRETRPIRDEAIDRIRPSRRGEFHPCGRYLRFHSVPVLDHGEGISYAVFVVFAAIDDVQVGHEIGKGRGGCFFRAIARSVVLRPYFGGGTRPRKHIA